MPHRNSPSKTFPQPLDRAALALMVVLSILIGGLLLKGDRAVPRVREFSWQGKQVGTEDIAFILTFSRPMDQSSVAENLRIDPPLPGKVSWAGRRMAYTLNAPAPYGTTFQLELQGARDLLSNPNDPRSEIKPFASEFKTRDRAFVYIGMEGDQQGRLVLQNLTQKQELVLTPENLVVMDFEAYPNGDRILFSASDRAEQSEGIVNPKLYTVTTGIVVNAPEALGTETANSKAAPPQSAGIVEEVLDNREYQNLRFDLSPDGQAIVLERTNRQDPGDYSLWIVKPDAAPEKLAAVPGGNFLITPDGQSLAILQGEGTAILPFITKSPEESDESTAEPPIEPLNFLPEYGRVLNFAKDGSAAAMVKFNTDFTEALFLVTNQGEERELLKTVQGGSILDAQFDALHQILYCLVTKATKEQAPENADPRTLFPGEIFVEQPYLVAIVLETGQQVDLLELPVQRDIQMSIAPDDLGILFDQIQSEAETGSNGDGRPLIRGSDGRAIASSQVWFLPIVLDEAGIPDPVQPESLLLSGIRPVWLP